MGKKPGQQTIPGPGNRRWIWLGLSDFQYASNLRYELFVSLVIGGGREGFWKDRGWRPRRDVLRCHM